MVTASKDDRPTLEPGPALVGRRWATLLVVLGSAASLDLLLTLGGSSPAWPATFVVIAAVAALSVGGLRRGGRALFVAAGVAAALSLAGTAGLAVAGAVEERWSGTDFGLAEGAALTFVLVACFRRAATRQALVVAAVALALLALPLRLGWSLDVVPFLLAALAVGAVAAAVGSTLRGADLAQRSAVGAVRRAEREEMARELHDVVAHHVTGMVVLTQAARALADRDDTSGPGGPAAQAPVDEPQLREALARVEHAGAEALLALRAMVGVLRSSRSDGQALPLEPTSDDGDLLEMVGRFRRSGAAARVDVAVLPGVRALPAPVHAAVQRVVQESLTNAARYARGAELVRVELTRTSSHVVVTVCDSGGPDDQAAGSGWTVGGGFGIEGMRERVEVLGGSLEAGPGASGGWRVRAEVPV